MQADLVGFTSTFALSIHEVIVQVNLTRLHVDYNPNLTAMLNSKTTPRAARGCGIRHSNFLAGPFHYVTRSPGRGTHDARDTISIVRSL